MPRTLPPHVERNHVKGKTYLSFRIGKGPRIRLPDDPASEEFKAAYLDALLGRSALERQMFSRATRGSIAALITSYMASKAYTGLRDTTKTGYSSRIETLREQHGHRSVSGLTKERIESAILGPYAELPGAELATLKMLRVLIKHARGLLPGNPLKLLADPSEGILRRKGKEIRAWTDAETAAFEAHWPVGTKQRTAYALMLHVGTARTDVRAITWAQFKAGGVTYTRNKTGVGVDMGVASELQAVLDAAKQDHICILTTAYGKPFTVAGFSGWMRDAITKAGLPLDCKPHGLRKTLGRRLADAGCTAHEIMAMLGHTTLEEAERYTREADRRRGGRQAVIKLEAHKANELAQTTSGSLGKRPKNREESI